MSVSIRAGGVTLPSPVELTASDEIIWSANTGRTSSGLMVGDVVAEKATWAIRWGVLTAAQLNTIRNNLVSGFFTAVITVDSSSVTLTAYRGTLTYDVLGTFGGVTYYKNAAVSIIQR